MTRSRLIMMFAAVSMAILPVATNAAENAVRLNGNIVLNKDSAGNATGVVFSNGDVMTAAPRDAKTIINGSGSPITGNVVATIGDFYLDTTSHLLYGPYAGSWPAGVSLVGPTGPAGPQGPANQVPWVVVTGTSQVAAENTGYVAMNDALTSITLPASPAVGSVVRIAGIGSGGWRTELNAGQYISSYGGYNVPPAAMGLKWTQLNNQTSWNTIATSSDGTKLVAAANIGLLYTSIDSGVTWTPREIIPGEGAVSRGWSWVTSSSDGTKLAAVSRGGQVVTSPDGGTTWNVREIIPGEGLVARQWVGIASSSDGTKLAAVVWNGGLYTSADSGSTWTHREIIPGEGDVDRIWAGVASSGNGAQLVAVAWMGGQFTSDDFGVTWEARQMVPGEGSVLRPWVGVTMSSVGTKLAAMDHSGIIFISTNGGDSWISTNINNSNTAMQSIASSSDGSTLIVSGGSTFISRDWGNTWTNQFHTNNMNSLTVTGDGSKFFGASSYASSLYSASSSNPITTGPRIFSSIESAIELLYVGGGRFAILSGTGGYSWEY